jgi:DNA-binding IclR family transcriptional regulator
MPRAESKTSQVIAMLKREGGTTLEEIMTAMGWQKHTTRAMLSAGGSLTKKHGLVVTSEKVGDKRTYTIKA